MTIDRRRSIITCVILTIITCGIYEFIWIARVHEDLENESQQYSGTSGGMVVLFSILTCGIYFLYWLYKSGGKISYIKRMDLGDSNIVSTSDNGLLYLILGIFGLGIVAMALMQSDLNDHFTLTSGWQDNVNGGGYGGGYGPQGGAPNGGYNYNNTQQSAPNYNTYGGPGATYSYGGGYTGQQSAPNYEQQHYEAPQYGQPQQPQYGESQYGQPQYGQPQQPYYEAPQYSQPAQPEQPIYSQPAKPDLQYGQFQYDAPAEDIPNAGPQMVWDASVPGESGPEAPVQDASQNDPSLNWYDQATEEASQPVDEPDPKNVE